MRLDVDKATTILHCLQSPPSSISSTSSILVQSYFLKPRADTYGVFKEDFKSRFLSASRATTLHFESLTVLNSRQNMEFILISKNQIYLKIVNPKVSRDEVGKKKKNQNFSETKSTDSLGNTLNRSSSVIWAWPPSIASLSSL